jgi:hypothetical protein
VSAERILSRIHIDTTTGCWLWNGVCNADGYGVVQAGASKRKMAHRVVYEMYRGQIPEGLHCDHLCRVHGCVNPWHIEPVTPRENVLRGIGPSARAAKATHCRRGHYYSPDNTRINSDGSRKCIACDRAECQAKRDRDVAAYNADARNRWAANRDAINARRRELAAQKRAALAPFRKEPAND